MMAEVTQIAFGETMRGHDVLLESFKTFFTAFSDNVKRRENIFVDGDWATIE